MIRCVILDDEPLAIDLLKSYVEKIDFLKLVFASESPFKAINFLNKENVDLVFLDIQMPEMNGLALMEILDNKIDIIVTTAYTEYALKGYEHNIIDYLLKPIDLTRFIKAADKAKAVIDSKKIALQAVSNNIQRNFFFVKTDSKLVKILFDEILFIESLRDYIAIHTEKETIIILDSLSNMEYALPTGLFKRIHKSYIASINKIDSIERNRVFIGKNIIPIGMTFRSELMSLIGK